MPIAKLTSDSLKDSTREVAQLEKLNELIDAVNSGGGGFPSITDDENGLVMSNASGVYISEFLSVTGGQNFNGGMVVSGTGNQRVIDTTDDLELGFYGASPVALQTGVAVTAGGIHAALVNLGLITA